MIKTLTIAETQWVSGGELTLTSENTMSTIGLYSGAFVGFIIGYAIGFPCAMSYVITNMHSGMLANELAAGSILLISSGIGTITGSKVGRALGSMWSF